MTKWRAISIPPLLKKKTSEVLHVRQLRYLESLSKLYNNQFGFRKGHSTSHTIRYLVDNINGTYESRKIPLTVIIDFRKAIYRLYFEFSLRRPAVWVSGIVVGY